jgi:hypothetical protein
MGICDEPPPSSRSLLAHCASAGKFAGRLHIVMLVIVS